MLSDAQRHTIYALSTPPGKAGVAVIRISGPDALSVWQGMVKTAGTHYELMGPSPKPWRMQRCRVVDPVDGEVLDDGLAVFFKGPRSFTAEDTLELHIHSGRAVIKAVLGALATFPALRPAEPGEFTRRAFESGRLDLTQVEGLRDLIDAETEGQRKLATRVARGDIRVGYERLRGDIIHCLAMVEALIDFGEGEDIEDGVYEQARQRASELHTNILNLLSDNRKGEIMRSGVRVVIFGPPNVGKSSFLNYLAQREAAIVTHIPGTTRDVLELSLDIGGLPVVVADTAGVRQTEDAVESIGVDRAKDAALKADATVCVLSLPDLMADHAAEAGSLQVPDAVRSLVKPDTIFLLNKADTVEGNTLSDYLSAFPAGRTWSCSVKTGDGMKTFMDGLTEILRERYDVLRTDQHSNDLLITHARHRVHLESALQFLQGFLDTPPEDVVLGAEELRYAAQAIGKISGLIDVEHVLDAVFSEFCIGK
ncbi:tRNA modification GTPase TrmE [Punctularia strigosozonata HHB-11173 SS5]|uniref:tRNA modification GTPase TrmE n=1 Tax=Punctularia strigosozonata (strain HHB-11173) TaxID=741275 RepID=UPI0004417341|nr:tRNA modification GTPase TrmE [Punctularia strigosozonata HHB-11173 SS5]EIN10245.1 tRNA modification GTPase TrmE [Punctularia strigosozonata HHB-11173 SS5]